MNRYWLSWVCTSEDHRPLSFPPNDGVLGWWCSGYDENDNATLCAVVSAESEDACVDVIRKDWPEFVGAWRIEPTESPPDWTPSDRFPLSDWMKPRFTPRPAGESEGEK